MLHPASSFSRAASLSHLNRAVQVLRQFGELPQDLVDMQKYAAWKAADINKALREGRQPAPGSSSSPPLAGVAPDAAPPEPRPSAEPDFAFPSAPATAAVAPSFPSSTPQGVLAQRLVTATLDMM